MVDVLESLVEDGIAIGGPVIADQEVIGLGGNREAGNPMAGGLIDGSQLVAGLVTGGQGGQELGIGGLREASGRVKTIGQNHAGVLQQKRVDRRGIGLDRRGGGVEKRSARANRPTNQRTIPHIIQRELLLTLI